MRKTILAAALPFFALASLACGQESATVPFNSKADLNVDFAGEAWKGAGTIDGFQKMGSSLNVMGLNMSEEAKQKTTVYLIRNGEALFFGFDCRDSAPEKFESGARENGKPTEWPRGDKIEVYIDGDRADNGKYYHFAYNASGDRAESLDAVVGKAGNWQVAHEVDKAGWRSAIRIPFATLGIDRATKSLKALFFRDYHPSAQGDGGERATWGGAPVHEPSAFGELNFVEGGEP